MTAPELRPLSLPLSMLLRPTLDVDWAAAACACGCRMPSAPRR